MEEKEYQQIIKQWKEEHKEEIESGKCKKVFLDNLPRWEDGRYKGNFNWKLCKGYKLYFLFHNIEGWIEITDVVGRYLYIRYNDNESFKILGGSLTECKLSTFLKIRTPEFKIKIDTKFKDEKRDIIIIDREHRKDKNGCNRKWYKYHCNKCGYEGWIEESNLNKRTGCAVCCPTPRTVVCGINSIVDTDKWMIPYFQGGYDEAKLYTCSGGGNPNNPKGYINPICPDCGRIRSKEITIGKIYTRHSISCSCGDGKSYGEKFIFNLLEQLDVCFETEYVPRWCKYKYKNKLRQGKYDFYFKLNNKEYIIEVDGGFHNKNNNMNGQTKEESKFIDDYKDKLALEHDIKSH